MTSAETKRPSRRRWLPQLSIVSLLLLTTCAAVWWGVWLARSEVARLALELEQSRELTRELLIKDRTLLSIVKQDERFYDENRWRVYVPREGMKLHVATLGIDLTGRTKLPPEASANLNPGEHDVELKVVQMHDSWHVLVKVDMEEVIKLEKEKSWNSNKGSSGGGMFERQADFKEGKPAVLFNRRFSDDWTLPKPKQPTTNGVTIWIE